MSGIIRQIEDSIIARLAQANANQVFGRLIKTVDRYSGEFADESPARLMEMAPFALVSHTRSGATVMGKSGAQWEGAFTIVCGSTSQRTGTMASRVGGPSPRELGSRQLAELARDLLAGQTLGLPIRALTPESLDEIYSGTPAGAPGQHRLSVTGLVFTCLYSTSILSATSTTSDVTRLLEIHADWIAPDAGVPATLPVSPAPDVQSDVQFGG